MSDKSGWVHPTLHINRDDTCGRCEMPLDKCDCCRCVWAPEAGGESGYIPEPDPKCPQHGTEAQLRDQLAWHEATYGRVAEIVGFDTAEPFPEAELTQVVARRLAAAEQCGYERAIEVLRDDERYGEWISSLGEFGIDRIVMARVEEGGTGYAASSMAVEYLTAVASSLVKGDSEHDHQV